MLTKKLAAETFGTFVLVFGGCGSAVFAATFGTTDLGIGFVGVSLAFGLTVLGCAYALGPISGCHLNPAVTLGLTVAGRSPAKDLVGYVIAQVVGAVAASALLLFLLQQAPGGYVASEGGLAANGFGPHSPGEYSMRAGFVSEVVLTFIFLIVIIGVTSPNAAPGFAGLAIGLTLTLVHLVGIPITNLSVNPRKKYWTCHFCGWLGDQSALAVLGGTIDWRCTCGRVWRMVVQR